MRNKLILIGIIGSMGLYFWALSDLTHGQAWGYYRVQPCSSAIGRLVSRSSMLFLPQCAHEKDGYILIFQAWLRILLGILPAIIACSIYFFFPGDAKIRTQKRQSIKNFWNTKD